MSENPSVPRSPEAMLTELENALVAMRDSFVKLSIELNDIRFDCDVEFRQEAVAQADAAIEKLKTLPVGAKPKSGR